MMILKNMFCAGVLCLFSVVPAQAEKSPQLYSCGGTEPLWSADITEGTLSFEMMGQEAEVETINWTGPAQGRPEDFIKGITAGSYTAVLRKQICK